QRSAMMALAPRTVQNIPDCLSLPTTVLQPASTTPDPTKNPAYEIPDSASVLCSVRNNSLPSALSLLNRDGSAPARAGKRLNFRSAPHRACFAPPSSNASAPVHRRDTVGGLPPPGVPGHDTNRRFAWPPGNADRPDSTPIPRRLPERPFSPPGPIPAATLPHRAGGRIPPPSQWRPHRWSSLRLVRDTLPHSPRSA